jgi:tRNA uridine 5-carboxymethylaminomethyl modification enzyme
LASDFDVIVIGAGHAGCEAAYAAARLGAHVGLCTLSRETVAHMPCNPAIGGTAKGHLVREIDALGGLMGRAIDATGIQFKLLNRSRGPAVWSPRAQADKKAYGAWVAAALDAEPNIEWVVGMAARILVRDGRLAGLEMEGGERFRCGSLVITAGTFLNGLIHIGPEQHAAGRAGEPPSRSLAESLKTHGFEWGRLKTGTPPRLDRNSIDFDACSERGVFHVEHGDVPAVPFSFSTPAIDRPQIPVTSSTRTTASVTWSAQTSTGLPSSTGKSAASVPGTARRSRTRSSASRTRSGTRSSSSPRGSTRARSTSTASP